DADAFIGGGTDVLVYVAIGVDDDGVTGGLAGDEVARLGELGIIEALQEHEQSYRGEQVVEGLREGRVGEHTIAQRSVRQASHHRQLDHGRDFATVDA